MGVVEVVGLVLTGALGLLGWFLRNKFSRIKEVDESVRGLDIRLTSLETKFDILGDINASLHRLRIDLEVIKARLSGKENP